MNSDLFVFSMRMVAQSDFSKMIVTCSFVFLHIANKHIPCGGHCHFVNSIWSSQVDIISKLHLPGNLHYHSWRVRTSFFNLLLLLMLTEDCLHHPHHHYALGSWISTKKKFNLVKESIGFNYCWNSWWKLKINALNKKVPECLKENTFLLVRLDTLYVKNK